jgi:hypothetical protein
MQFWTKVIFCLSLTPSLSLLVGKPNTFAAHKLKNAGTVLYKTFQSEFKLQNILLMTGKEEGQREKGK